MSFFVAIVGLGFLIFVHELGHFTASLALRMRPRRFYIGFPPPLWKTTRNGIEYGIGTIPLGGFVKIPGMHRPAPTDVDTHFGRVVGEAPELAGPLARLREALAVGDLEGAGSCRRCERWSTR
jgi:membrane-associated protease RseP (regulator of RpoE activity)